MMFRAAVLKLTAQYVILAMILCVVFSIVFYGFATHELSEGLNSQFHVLSSNDRDGDNVGEPHDNISGTELHTRSGNLKADLIAFNSLIFIVSILLGYLLARRTLRPIEEAHATQVRFTAEASHELRTPITAMKADTESILMERQPTPKLLRQGLESNLKDIERLERLSSHLLSMARYKSAANQSIKLVDLAQILPQVIKETERIYKDRNLQIKTALKPAVIHADPMDAEQLFSIVIDNAMKYSQPEGVINIAIHTESNQAVVTIKDKGIGIASDDLTHVFEHFYRSTAARKSDIASGYGLGLPLAHDIAKLYKGTLELESVEGKGTTVTIILPISK